jgi:hypothetical protein
MPLPAVAGRAACGNTSGLLGGTGLSVDDVKHTLTRRPMRRPPRSLLPTATGTLYSAPRPAPAVPQRSGLPHHLRRQLPPSDKPDLTLTHHRSPQPPPPIRSSPILAALPRPPSAASDSSCPQPAALPSSFRPPWSAPQPANRYQALQALFIFSTPPPFLLPRSSVYAFVAPSLLNSTCRCVISAAWFHSSLCPRRRKARDLLRSLSTPLASGAVSQPQIAISNHVHATYIESQSPAAAALVSSELNLHLASYHQTSSANHITITT